MRANRHHGTQKIREKRRAPKLIKILRTKTVCPVQKNFNKYFFMGKPQLETLWLWQVPGIQAGDSHSLLFWASWYTPPSHFAGIERWPGKNIKNWHKPPCTTQRAIIRMWQGQKRQRDSLVCPFPSLPCRGQIVSRLSWANKLRLPMRIVRICSAFSFFFPPILTLIPIPIAPPHFPSPFSCWPDRLINDKCEALTWFHETKPADWQA